MNIRLLIIFGGFFVGFANADLQINMANIPAGSALATEVSALGMTSCTLVCLPASAGNLSVLRLILLGGSSQPYQAISGAGSITLQTTGTNNAFNAAPYLANGIYFIVQQPSFPINSNQNLRYSVYDNTGKLLTTNIFGFNNTQPDYYPQIIAGIGKYAYQVSPTYQFSGPANSLFFIQSPVVNVNGKSQCVPIPVSGALTKQGVTSAIGVPLAKSFMTMDLKFAITQSASTYPCYFVLNNISKIATAALLTKGVYVVLGQPLTYNSSAYAGSGAKLTYALYDAAGTPIQSSSATLTMTMSYFMPNQWVDNLEYIIGAKNNPVPNQKLPSQAQPLGLYVYGDCLDNPLLVTKDGATPVAAPYSTVFFLQYAPSGQVKPGGNSNHIPANGQAAQIAAIQTSVATAATSIESYGGVAMLNSTSPVIAAASPAISDSWDIIYDLYDLIVTLSPKVAGQLPASLKRPA